MSPVNSDRCIALLCTHYTGKFFITARNVMTTVCFNCVKQVSISITSTGWYLLYTLIYTGELGSSFVISISSHEVTIIFSSPSWWAFIMRRNHYLVSTTINLTQSTWYITLAPFIVELMLLSVCCSTVEQNYQKVCHEITYKISRYLKCAVIVVWYVLAHVVTVYVCSSA